MARSTIHCGCGTVFEQTQSIMVCENCGTRHYRHGNSYDFDEEELR